MGRVTVRDRGTGEAMEGRGTRNSSNAGAPPTGVGNDPDQGYG